MFFCARSMTASRSPSFCRFSAVLCLVFSSELPSRCETEFEPLVDGVRELRLALGQQSDHGFEPRRRVSMRARQLGHHRVLGGCRLARAPQHDRQDGNRPQPIRIADNGDDRGAFGHRLCLTRFAAGCGENEERTLVAHLRLSAATDGARLTAALCTTYIADHGCCAKSSNFPTSGCGSVSEPVKRIDAGIRKLVEDMFETMYDAPGIGLAAIQVGVAKRVVTMDLSKKKDDHKPQVFINPEITWASEEKSTYEEGCLSIPEYYEEVDRPTEVKVKYLDLDGNDARDRGQGPVSRPASSTRSTTSTASCSSTISPSSSATASSRNSPRRPRQRRRWRPDWRSAWCSWARPTSLCPRCWRLSAAAMRSPRSIPAHRSRPGAEWRRAPALSRAKPGASASRSSRRRR